MGKPIINSSRCCKVRLFKFCNDCNYRILCERYRRCWSGNVPGEKGQSEQTVSDTEGKEEVRSLCEER